jgi:hypothetical protein
VSLSTEEIILHVGAEGGDFTLYGTRTGNGWRISLNVYDCTALLLDESPEASALADRRARDVAIEFGFSPKEATEMFCAVPDPEPVGKDEPTIQHRSSPVTSWADAIALLDRYPWAKLHPLAVHPKFRKRVWGEVQRRLDHDGGDHYALDRWRRICKMRA